jgi:hypothetical protein
MIATIQNSNSALCAGAYPERSLRVVKKNAPQRRKERKENSSALSCLCGERNAPQRRKERKENPSATSAPLR